MPSAKQERARWGQARLEVDTHRAHIQSVIEKSPSKRAAYEVLVDDGYLTVSYYGFMRVLNGKKGKAEAVIDTQALPEDPAEAETVPTLVSRADTPTRNGKTIGHFSHNAHSSVGENW